MKTLIFLLVLCIAAMVKADGDKSLRTVENNEPEFELMNGIESPALEDGEPEKEWGFRRGYYRRGYYPYYYRRYHYFKRPYYYRYRYHGYKYRRHHYW